MPLSCYRLSSSTNFPMPRANLQTANSTSALNHHPAIICPPLAGFFDRNDVLNAVMAHVGQTQIYERDAAFVTAFPPFKAVFKRGVHAQYIRELLMQSKAFPLVDGLIPQVVCLRTEAEAQPYGQDLWYQCMDTPSWVDLPSSTIFLCPTWVHTQVDRQGPDPLICPTVAENVFADNARMTEFPITRSFAITRFALALYGRNHLIGYWPLSWSVQHLNSVIQNGPVKSAFGDNRSYYVYLFCESNLSYYIILLL